MANNDAVSGATPLPAEDGSTDVSSFTSIKHIRDVHSLLPRMLRWMDATKGAPRRKLGSASSILRSCSCGKISLLSEEITSSYNEVVDDQMNGGSRKEAQLPDRAIEDNRLASSSKNRARSSSNGEVDCEYDSDFDFELEEMLSGSTGYTDLTEHLDLIMSAHEEELSDLFSRLSREYVLSDPSSLWRGVEGIVEIASSIAKAIEADRLKEKSCDDAPITRSRSSSLPRDLQKAAFLEAGKEKDDCMQHKLMRSSVSASNLKCIPLYDMCTGLDTSIDGFGDYDNDEDMYINELKYTRNSSQCCSECFKHQWSLQLISQQKSRSGDSHYSTSAVVDVSFDDDNNNSDVDNIEEKDDILLSTDKRVIKMGEMKDFDHIFDSSLGDLDHDVIDSARNHNSSATAVTSQHVDQINAITINSKSANCSDPSISSADDGTATIAALRDFENQATFMAGLHENNQSTRSTIAVMGAQYRHSMKAVSNSQQHFQFAIRICLTHSGKKALQSYQGLSDDAINSLGRSKVNEMDASLIEQQFDEDALAQAYASSSQRLLHWLESSQESASMFHFTIFRDFQSLRAFQYDIQHLLLATGMHPPQFPPLVNVAGMLDDFLRASKGKKGGEKEKLNFYLASATMNKNKAEVEESEARLYTYILQIQEYLQGVFVLIKAIDEDSRIFHESATATQEGCVEAMAVDDTSPGILKHVEDSDNLSLAAERGKSNKMTRPVDKKTLSLLVGKFLLGGGANNSHRKSPIASTDDEPSWFPFVAHSLRLVVDGAGSTSGSALLLKNQEELLLRQRSRCIGCGETLVSNFIGLRKNYRQCRFHGGLFCKRWCHYSEKRIIPYRLLFYWDNKPLPVCNQSAIFIDSLLDKCLFKLDRINPLLYDGVPTLRLARALRQKIAHRLGASARHTLLDFETIIDASSRSFGLSRFYLLITDDLYSLNDFADIISGKLISLLQNSLTNLKHA